VADLKTTPLAAAVLAGFALLGPPAAAAVELNGSVAVSGRGAGPEGAVVYYQPAAGAPAVKPLELTLETRGKEFVPRVLVLPVGSRVRFPNRDPILHNVFSVSGGNSFDLGLYAEGPGKTHTFDDTGLVRVYCNVHHSMVAYVLVLDTPFYTVPGADGRWTLHGLPEGPGRLTVWHERGEEQSRELRLPAAGPVSVEIEASRPRVPTHRNKFGRSYKRSRRDRY